MSSLRSWSGVTWIPINGALFIAVLLILLSSFPSPSWAQGRVVLFLLPELEGEVFSLAHTPALETLVQEGALALMNTRTGDTYHPQSTYLTAGTGRRAVSKGDFLPVLLENGGEAFLPQYQSLYALNQAGDYLALPGLLGEILKDNQLKRVIITDSQELTPVFLLMDRDGRVPTIYLSSPAAPSFASLLTLVLSQTDLLLLDVGQSSQGGFGGDSFSCGDMDVLCGLLLEALNPQRDLLLLMSPTPSQATVQAGSNLTPLLAWGAGIEPGVLTSSTTRQQALVSSLDVLPTILSFFSLPQDPSLPGGRITSLPLPMSWEQLEDLHVSFIHTAGWRPLFIKAFVFFQIILLSLALLFLLFRRPFLPLKAIFSFCGRFLFFIPLIFLLFGFFPGEILPMVLLLIFLGLLPAFFLPRFLPRPLDQFLFPVSLTLFALLLDLFFGPLLLRRSLLGYDPIIGARFYGIGNEYMGILLGASIIGSTALWDRFPRISLFFPTVLFFTVMTLLLFFWGANLGGTFSALFTFSCILLLLKYPAFSMRKVLLSFAITFILLLFFILVEYTFFMAQSHIGQTLVLFWERGFGEIYPIILRKLEMNMKLLRWTIWTRVLLAFLLFFVLFFKRPPGLMEQALGRYPHVKMGLWAAVLGSLVTMLVNDSGVVAMATTLFFPVFSIFYLILDTQE